MSAITAPPPVRQQANVTSPAAPAPLPTRMPADTEWLRRFTVEEFGQMVAQGLFDREPRIELLEGLIVRKMPRDPLDDACLAQTAELLRGRIPTGWHVRNQSSVLTSDSQPEPDLLIVRGTPAQYVSRHPSAADAALIVEVSNSSLADDRAWKGRIYAAAGFPLYWILNLVDRRRVEVYSDPSGAGPAPAYRRHEEFGPGDLVPLTIAGVSASAVPVDELLLLNVSL